MPGEEVLASTPVGSVCDPKNKQVLSVLGSVPGDIAYIISLVLPGLRTGNWCVRQPLELFICFGRKVNFLIQRLLGRNC